MSLGWLWFRYRLGFYILANCVRNSTICHCMQQNIFKAGVASDAQRIYNFLNQSKKSPA